MMAGSNELGLADLFEESDMKMQSSTIYRALRGDGMRVRPLARTRSSIGKSQTSPAKSGSRPGSCKPEKGRVAAIKNMFELKVASKNEPPKTLAKEVSCKTQIGKAQDQNRLNSPKKPATGVKKRDLTPVSESSTQRVPFRSTKLERPVSRASLKEEESENKGKTLRRTIDTRMLQKKSVPLFEILPKVKDSTTKEGKADGVAVALNRNGNKRRTVKRKRLGVTRRATVVAGKPVIVRDEPLAVPRKEEAMKTEAGLKNNKIGTSGAAGTKLKTRPKPKVTPTPSMELPRIPSIPKTPASNKTTRNAIVREVLPKIRIASPLQPPRKQLWLPTETRDSYNQFCPDTKAKRTTLRRKRPPMKKRVKENESNVHETRGGTAQTLAKSKFENTTEEESSETDEEEARMMQRMQKRKELERKSMEFFNQFRYGEMLRKSMPKIRYTSEILAKSEAEVKRRMTEMEVRMRLSRLDESVSNINGLVPKWNSMLPATKDIGKIESIQKTLVNAEKILEGKVGKARSMLEQYLVLIKTDAHSPPTEEMQNIETHSELVQLDMDSLERIFESYERQLEQELAEPTSISL